MLAKNQPIYMNTICVSCKNLDFDIWSCNSHDIGFSLHVYVYAYRNIDSKHNNLVEN